MARRFLTLILAVCLGTHGSNTAGVGGRERGYEAGRSSRRSKARKLLLVLGFERLSGVKRGRELGEEGVSWPQPLRSCRGLLPGWLVGFVVVVREWLFGRAAPGFIKQARIPGPFFCDAGAGGSS